MNNLFTLENESNLFGPTQHSSPFLSDASFVKVNLEATGRQFSDDLSDVSMNPFESLLLF